MLYPVLTVLVGSIMVIISAISLALCAREGGIFINQVRFLASGILLVLHFPLTHLLAGVILSRIQTLGAIDDSAIASYWAAMALIVSVQLVILPTSRELYATYLADRLTHRGSA